MTLVQQPRRTGAVATAAAPLLPSRLRHPWQHRWARRRQQRAWARRQAEAWQLQDILVGLELSQYGHAQLGHRTVHVPRVIGCEDGPPPAFLVRPLAGQTLADYQDHANAIAECLGVARVRLSRTVDSVIRVELLTVDPLDTVVDEGPALLASSAGPVLLGVDDVDSRYRVSPFELGHTVVQGQTRSGKSAFVYWLLSQMASAPDLLIAGSDPTGLLLRPFAGTVHEPWQVLGMGDPDAHVKLLRHLVTEMDARIAAIPPRSDQITPDATTPLIVCVLEEYAGLLRAVDDSGSGRKSARVSEVQRLIARLLSEGHKAAIRLLIILQRADAAVLGGFERGQCSVRISFRVDTADAVVMLHPSGRAEAEQHATCPPGLALLSAPGVQLARIRAPYLGDGSDGLYGVYADLVTARAAR